MSRERQLGTAFETLILGEIQEYKPGAIRRGNQGALDKADFYIPEEDRFALEAKRVDRMNLSGWLKEAEREARNAGATHGVVVHKRRAHGRASDQYCTLRFGAFLDLVYPDA